MLPSRTLSSVAMESCNNGMTDFIALNGTSHSDVEAYRRPVTHELTVSVLELFL